MEYSIFCVSKCPNKYIDINIVPVNVHFRMTTLHSDWTLTQSIKCVETNYFNRNKNRSHLIVQLSDLKSVRQKCS